MYLFHKKIVSHGDSTIHIGSKLRPKKYKIRINGRNDIWIGNDLICLKKMEILVEGSSNSIQLKGNGHMPSVRISVIGDGNQIEVGGNFNGGKAHSGELRISITGNNNRIQLSDKIEVVSALDIDLNEKADGRSVSIGESTTFFKTDIQSYDPYSSVIIGKDCMFSFGTTVYHTDGHAIFQDGKLINKAETCRIGDRVWVGWGATVMKNCRIPNGTIVGRAALVTRSFEQENTAIGGIPAKVIKENITWSRETPAEALNAIRFGDNI